MTQFSSRTPRDLNSDPFPYRNRFDGSRWRDPGVDTTGNTVVFDPRPEFDHVQHNPTNPILIALRRRFPNPQNSAWSIYQDTLDALTLYGVAEMQRIIDRDGIEAVVTSAHVDHAVRVLTRLVRVVA